MYSPCRNKGFSKSGDPKRSAGSKDLAGRQGRVLPEALQRACMAPVPLSAAHLPMKLCFAVEVLLVYCWSLFATMDEDGLSKMRVSMWEGFVDRATRTVVIAQQAAWRFGSRELGTEHFLFAILSEVTTSCTHTLRSYGVDEFKVGKKIAVGERRGTPANELALSAHAQRAMDIAHQQGSQSNTGAFATVDVDHMLLGLLSVPDGRAVKVLEELGVNTDKVRLEIATALRQAP